MFSKLCALQVKNFSLPSIRHLGGLTPLEKFERLRQLCCTSDIAKKVAQLEGIIKPQRPEEPEADPCCKPEEKMSIRCKAAMVVGGGSGIGYETADNLLMNGAIRVVIADINQAAGTDAAKKLNAAHGENKAFYLKTDISEQPSIESAFKEYQRFFDVLDIYINCAGIYNETPSCWEKMVKVNLMGCVRGTLLAYDYLKKHASDPTCKGSVIVNVSSYGSIANVPSMPLFSATSNAINGLTSSFGQNFHYNNYKVRFVTVCPSCTDSGLLKNMEKNHYDKQWASHSPSAMKCCTKQSAKIVGRAIVNAVRFGSNGSVYVVKEGKYYKYAMPDHMKIMRQESVLF